MPGKRGRPRKTTPPKVVVDQLKPGDPAPEVEAYTVADTQTVMSGDLTDLTFLNPMTRPPDPPACIMERLKKEDKVWRWMGKAMVRKLGMRMYETISPTAKERELIDRGQGTEGGIRVGEDNVIYWWEDAFLAAIPRKYYLMRRAAKQRLTEEQSKKARDTAALREAAARAGTKIEYRTVEQKISSSEFD
jgi:hypothetical protein